jgi:hypothetical protein
MRHIPQPMKTKAFLRFSPLASLLALLASTGCIAGCTSDPVAISDDTFADTLAKELIAACPMSGTGDASARATCADNLTKLDTLRDSMNEPFFWGGQKAGTGNDYTQSPRTDFNPLVFRRVYLSTFMFTGEYTVEKTADTTILHLEHQFRSELDIGDYPYPFWHAQAKWTSYQQSVELLFFIKDGKILGALRSEEQDPARPLVNHTWDGKWQWMDPGGEIEPYVTLYTFLFSPNNPHVTKLDDAYRALEEGLRAQSCQTCHSPDNAMKVNPLELFNYPNQALTARHDLVTELTDNTMPPPNYMSLPVGITDMGQRNNLKSLAETFAKTADDALSYEGENVKP